jgi:hypothetical protein
MTSDQRSPTTLTSCHRISHLIHLFTPFPFRPTLILFVLLRTILAQLVILHLVLYWVLTWPFTWSLAWLEHFSFRVLAGTRIIHNYDNGAIFNILLRVPSSCSISTCAIVVKPISHLLVCLDLLSVLALPYY